METEFDKTIEYKLEDYKELRNKCIQKIDFIEEYGNSNSMREGEEEFIDDVSIKIRKNNNFNITWPIQKWIIDIYKRVENEVG